MGSVLLSPEKIERQMIDIIESVTNKSLDKDNYVKMRIRQFSYDLVQGIRAEIRASK